MLSTVVMHSELIPCRRHRHAHRPLRRHPRRVSVAVTLGRIRCTLMLPRLPRILLLAVARGGEEREELPVVAGGLSLEPVGANPERGGLVLGYRRCARGGRRRELLLKRQPRPQLVFIPVFTAASAVIFLPRRR